MFIEREVPTMFAQRAKNLLTCCTKLRVGALCYKHSAPTALLMD